MSELHPISNLDTKETYFKKITHSCKNVLKIKTGFIILAIEHSGNMNVKPVHLIFDFQMMFSQHHP